MDINEAIRNRHSVRSYLDKPIPNDTINEIKSEISECNKESGLHIQLVSEEPEAFSGFMAHYGKFSGVKNYIALIGKKSPDIDEKLGYYGERIAIKAHSAREKANALLIREKSLCVYCLWDTAKRREPHIRANRLNSFVM